MQNKSKRKVYCCSCKNCQLHPYSQVTKQHQAINRVLAELNERNKRQFVGVLANQRGRGGASQLAEITGVSRKTIARGCAEITGANKSKSARIRRIGAGRPLLEKNSRGY